MVSATASDPLLAAALWTGIFALAASVALLASIALIRWRLLRRLARERILAARWNPLIAECAERVPQALPPLARRDYETFLVLWCRAQESLRGEAQAHLRELAGRLGLGTEALRLARARDLRRRLLGIVALGHLRAREALPLLETQILTSSPASSLAAVHALLRIDAAMALPRLLAAAVRREDWPLTTVMSILKEADPGLVGPVLAAAIRSESRLPGQGPGLARLLRLAGAAHAEYLRGVVLEVLSAMGSPESLAPALGCLWNPDDAVHARRLLDHVAWPVRVAAARALGRLGDAADFDALAARLADPSWWVRYRAAQALCSLPGIGRAELDGLRSRLEDRFALDILRQALAERPA